MAIKIFGILIALFTISFTILSLQDPYSLNLKNYSLDFKNIEANSLDAYELNSSMIKSYYKAHSWTRYENKDVFKNFVNLNLDFNLSAHTLELLGKDFNQVVFEGDVVYLGKDKTKLLSPKMQFNPREKILSTHLGFKAFIDGNIINGNVLNYDIKNKILQVQGVQAWLQGS
ncbi:hypothetical protein [Campylobacter cuniculorum]|uniref:LPS export ABC transporter periplasmic protein LptC n=2 Tax=Campylobacter cuniculorum TaxID=374106 RepID=A0ABX6U1Q9_9BACT|nr:hypothetical protein [Campylobacter cuniculorum]ARJ56314.1 putative lipooligosaccharide transport system, substrate-binding component (LptC family) [Campylobacter cuniculorum DSM 23162 = LMG 24588]QOR03803.1 hypothetical protein A0071_06360 [Campylobacter cuniculorum]